MELKIFSEKYIVIVKVTAAAIAIKQIAAPNETFLFMDASFLPCVYLSLETSRSGKTSHKNRSENILAPVSLSTKV